MSVENYIPNSGKTSRSLVQNSSVKRFVIVVAVIFATEFTIHVLLHIISLPEYIETIIDPLFLVMVLFPVLYALVLSPLLQEIVVRRTAEQALRESEERYRHLVEHSPEAIAVHNGKKLLYVNDAAAELLGAPSPADLLGRDVLDFVQPDYIETVSRRIKRIKKSKTSEPLVKERLNRLDGTIIDVEVVSTFVTYRGEAAVQVIVHNVTQRKRAERKLTEIYAKLRDRKAFIESIVFNLQSGIIVTDLEMIIKLANPYSLKYSCDSSGVMAGRNLGDVFPELYESIATGLDFDEIKLRHKSADTIIGYKRFDLKGFDGAVVGSIITFVDITEISKIRAEMKLKERLATIGEVVARVAHEMRNPLFGMTAVGQILDMELQLTPGQKQLMQSFLIEARRLNNLVEELLSSCKDLTLHKEMINLKRIIDASITISESYANKKEVHIVRNVSDQDFKLTADPDKIEQVLLNLIKNAVEASGKGGKVQVLLETDDRHAIVNIIDAGHGIAEDIGDKLFDIFFTTKKHGTGMGLSISKKIVEAHGGTLTSRNNVDTGATFTVTLPLIGDAL